METNKLTLEDNFLSLEQAKELQELGIDFENGNYLIWNESEEIIAKSDILGFIGDDYTPTLSVAEMIEMLPMEIKCMEGMDLTSYSLLYDGYSISYVYWLGAEIINTKISVMEIDNYPLENECDICIKKWNIRDALFEMLKWLKQNKLI